MTGTDVGRLVAERLLFYLCGPEAFERLLQLPIRADTGIPQDCRFYHIASGRR